jgi:DNA-binding XRE family transcriptional regulator
MIEEARNWYKAGMTQEAIALDFGVSQKCISNWVKGVKDV